MQIGEFARICDTKISVLRHYDKEGLLIPDEVDRFTGYRYYSKEQIPVFVRITALKKAGFSLSEIKQILLEHQSSEQLLSLFETKRAELTQTLDNLAEAREMLLRENAIMSVTFIKQGDITCAKSKLCDANYQNEIREEVERAIKEQGYQRISGYRTYGEKGSNQVYVACDVIKLADTVVKNNENTDITFENDSTIVGKWQIVGEYAVKEDFYGDVCSANKEMRDIYFLPNGENYWCYSWSKGKLICRFGDYSFVNNFYVENYDGNRYMFVEFKSYEYRHGGMPTVLVLRQLDNNEYTIEDVAHKDNIELPFENDEKILGTWKVKDFCRSIEVFDPSATPRQNLFFKRVTFKEQGEVISIYGDKTICGEHMQTWTKGYILRKWNRTACAYKICTIDDREYLFIEWKSGDYIYGSMEPCYYVFERDFNYTKAN